MPYTQDLIIVRGAASCDWPMTRAVGWLAAGHEFAKGSIPPEALERLRLLHSALRSGRILNPMIAAGLQECDFCAADGRRHAENMELRIRGRDGAVFLAPAMVVQYIDVHGYRPPAPFVEAILSAVGPTDLVEGQAAWAADVIAHDKLPALRWL